MILSRSKLNPQQRFDLEAYVAEQAACRVDSKLYVQKFLSSQNHILNGFAVSGIGLTSAVVGMANAALIAPQNSVDFSYFVSAPSDPDVTIAASSLTVSSRNYLEASLATLDGTPIVSAFWDPEANAGNGAEFNQIVNTITDLEVKFVVLTGGFSGSPDRLPVAIVDVDGSGVIKLILDRRELYGRLSKPENLDNSYAWGSKVEPVYSLNLTSESGTFVSGETLTIGGETATVVSGGTTNITFNAPTGINYFNGSSVTGGTSGATGTVNTVLESFTGVDKNLYAQKDINDALATELKTIKDVRFWWQDVDYSSDVRGVENDPLARRVGVLTDAVGDEQEDRSGYLRSDDPVAWDGNSLSFTANLVLEFVNTKSGTLTQHTVLLAGSPIVLNNLESAYVLINRSSTSENVSVIRSGTTPIPAQSQSEKDVFVLFRRQDAAAGHFLHIPFHKQLLTPGSTVRLGATGTGGGGGGGGGTSPLFEQEVPSGTVNGVNNSFALSHTLKTSSAAVVLLDTLKVPASQVSVTGTSVTFSGSSTPQFGQRVEVFYIADTINTLTSSQEVPSGTINGSNATFTLAGTPPNAASILVFVDGKKANVSEWNLVGTNQIVFTAGNIPQVGQSLEAFFVQSLGTTSVVQEIPSGTVDGSNDTFSLSVSAPYKNAAAVFVDGRKSALGDWSLISSGSEVRFGSGFIPQPGQRVELYYFVVTGGGGGSSESLNDAYLVGATITTTSGVPFTVGGAASKVAVFNGDITVTGVIDPKGLTFDPQGSTPLTGSQNGIWATSAGDLIHSRPSMPDVNLTQTAVSSYKVNRFTLSPTDITNGFVTLSGNPVTVSSTILNVIGLVTQSYGDDFTVSGATLSWTGLGLDGILSSGDKLVVQFS